MADENTQLQPAPAEPVAAAAVPDADHPTLMHHELLDLFDELTFREKWTKVWHGIRQPKDTGDYKFARLQLIRMSAPIAAVLTPVVAVGCMMIFGDVGGQKNAAVTVMVMEAETVPDLEQLPDEPEEPIEPPPPVEMTDVQNVNISDVNVLASVPVPASQPGAADSAKPAAFDSVAIVKSPVVMRGIYATREAGARGQAVAEYGGAQYGTEGAVIRALRWLKANQLPNGSWQSPPTAMTALALLCFLAHGEQPSSAEFGECVEKAIKYLLSVQQESGRFPGNYDIPIAVYAMSEAYALTRVPQVKDAAEKGVKFVIEGQHESGGWDYNCQQSQRDDTSYMGWCVQALKAAYGAGVESPGLKRAMKKAISGMKKNSHPEGGFGYTGPGQGGLTGVGVLSMQFLGAANEPEAKKGLVWLDRVTCIWKEPWGARPLYYWYYITQCKFHAGGKVWNDWNKQFAPELVKAQKILEGKGPKGEDLGFWESPTEQEAHGGIYNTTLCTLMLEVYYRYLPTYKPPSEVKYDDSEAAQKDDVEVKITL